MKKQSYKSAPDGEEPEVRGPSVDLVDKETATESGGRGFNLVEMTSDFDAVDPDIYDENVKSDIKSGEKVLSDDIMNLLVTLGDEMDNTGERSLANFADFLINKFAQVENISSTRLFNQLMIKINNADLTNTNDILKKLTKIYSRTIVLEYMNSKDLEKSKESAYKKTLHRADQYLSEG
jgi:hypothetical protein